MSNHNPLFFYLKIRHDKLIEGAPSDPLVRSNVDSRRDGDLAGQEDHQSSPFLTIIKAMAARSRSPSLDTVFAPDFPRSRIMGSDDQKVSPAIWMFKIRAVTVATGPVFAHQDKNGGKNGRSDNQRHSKRYR
jgi:hypothetical protein